MRFLIAVVLSLSVVGCSANLSRESAYHDGVKQLTIESGMVKEYEGYVKNDPKLKDTSKKIRLATPQKLRDLIAEEEKALKKEDD